MSPRALTRRQKQAETRSSLMRSAAKLFCRHGLEGASVEDVAQDAGFTKGAFYSNFKSKEELFLVMLDERFSERLDQLEEMLGSTPDSTEEQAHDTALDFIRTFRDDEEWKRLYFEFVAYAMRNDEFREELATRHRALRARLAEMFRSWAVNFPGEPPVSFEQIAAMTDFMADGFLLNRMVDHDLDEDTYATMLAIFYRGLLATTLGWEPDPGEVAAATS